MLARAYVYKCNIHQESLSTWALRLRWYVRASSIAYQLSSSIGCARATPARQKQTTAPSRRQMVGGQRQLTQSRLCLALAAAVSMTAQHSAVVPLPRFSWETLPVFLHTQNSTCGDWNAAAAARAAQYPLSYSGMTGMRQSDGSMISQEVAAPAVCRRIAALNK